MYPVSKLFGSVACNFLANDDKAKVPIGLPAANIQSPILMNMRYEVRLPDHNFVVASRHHLTPSVCAICDIDDTGNVKNTRDTFIRIRSGKHESSTPYTHLYDIKHLFDEKLVPQRRILLYII